VSNSDSLVSKSLNFVSISLADIILVDAGIATLGVHRFSLSAIIFQIVVSVEENIFEIHTPPFFTTTNNTGRSHLSLRKRNLSKNRQMVIIETTVIATVRGFWPALKRILPDRRIDSLSATLRWLLRTEIADSDDSDAVFSVPGTSETAHVRSSEQFAIGGNLSMSHMSNLLDLF
jgi:hypothetical protein